MFLIFLLAYFCVFSSREANSIVPLTDPSNANILPSNEKDHLLPTNHLLRKLFALIHTMSHSKMVFQNRASFIILATCLLFVLFSVRVRHLVNNIFDSIDDTSENHDICQDEERPAVVLGQQEDSRSDLANQEPAASVPPPLAPPSHIKT